MTSNGLLDAVHFDLLDKHCLGGVILKKQEFVAVGCSWHFENVYRCLFFNKSGI